MKKRSKVIKDLIMDKINVLQALESLSFMLEDMGCETFDTENTTKPIYERCKCKDSKSI